MTRRGLLSGLLLATLILLGGITGAQQSMAQSADQAAPKAVHDDETNLETQLYLVVGTNQEVEKQTMPAALEPVIRQLRSSLPFQNYRLAATLINRVKNQGRLNLRWVGGPLASGATSASTPSFSEFKVNMVRLVDGGDGRTLVRMDGFSFGARIPIHTSSTVASNALAAPVFNYENTGLNTDISMKEGEPVVVGTLNTGPSGDAIILIVSARRTSK